MWAKKNFSTKMFGPERERERERDENLNPTLFKKSLEGKLL